MNPAKGSTILIVDDEPELALTLARLVSREGLTPVLASDGPSALHLVRSEHPDVILLDFKMPGMDGMEVMRRAKRLDEDLPVILITAFAEVRGAVEAMRAGAYDYLAKPFNHQEVVRMVLRALGERDLKRRLEASSSLAHQDGSLREIFGPSPEVSRLIADIGRVAKANFSVVIQGETGSGKEVVARAIHAASLRAMGLFIPLDCGAIPEALLESELFGHERGAFTGADRQKPGTFEVARGGTLFLDEVSNLPLPSQAKLLRTLQEKVICRVGGVRPIGVDVRLLAACNDDLERLSESGAFRRDLYFRLNEFTIRIPPLRERKQDIPYLAQRFMDITNAELSKKVRGFSAPAMQVLLDHGWPGNVRQLRSAIRRAVLLAGEVVTESELDLDRRPATAAAGGPEAGLNGSNGDWAGLPLREIVKRNTRRLEREVIEQVLRTTGGNKAKAARLLHIDYKTIHSKVKEYSIRIEGE
ncbi:MAG: sigma-54 dependent transcriptional regulator [Bryobacterales bacterium]|nr:sigma-54 dependent transcriptional regulator [Bryobacterales bacterium]